MYLPLIQLEKKAIDSTLTLLSLKGLLTSSLDCYQGISKKSLEKYERVL